MNQKGFSPLVILILVVLGVFIFWELTLIIQNPSGDPQPISQSASPTAPECAFPDPNDPCDLDSGSGFDL